MDLERLEQDWKTDPALEKYSTFMNVHELAAFLVDVHKYLVDPERSGSFSYLYRKQIERNRELQKELDDVKRKLASSRR